MDLFGFGFGSFVLDLLVNWLILFVWGFVRIGLNLRLRILGFDSFVDGNFVGYISLFCVV